VAWKRGYLWFIWFIWLVGSLVIGPSLAGLLVQAEEIIRTYRPSLLTTPLMVPTPPINNTTLQYK
jgi:hypothetical protein